nr:immunoglobulin heavy chain junction region [Macaca mulatta]MOW19119.1 immunoglobulin heavy chain junction region [Macaca mulatta]MOW19829.1 immunoglobulin heavy chain junction region [Macaca mulatta]MOW19960.1 immunoglobulin heavy chain junction region [Macaca mulatta]MOW20119.1 immunoglobulin heavy chain junction region [Macaca mulatta]
CARGYEDDYGYYSPYNRFDVW